MTRRHERRPEVTHYDAAGQPKNTATAAAANVYTLYVADTAQTQTFTDADTALLAASAGDMLRLPSGTITGNHTITPGVEVLGGRNTLLTGAWTGASGATLRDVRVSIAADSALSYGLAGPAAGTFYVYGCTVEVSNTGDAAAIYSNLAGRVEAYDCTLSALSTTGNGYCLWRTATGGAGDLYRCRFTYSTGRALEE
jgi:hypothetical protein